MVAEWCQTCEVRIPPVAAVYQRQLSVPFLRGRLTSTSKSCRVNGHTTWCISPVSVVLRLWLVSGWGLVNGDQRRPMGPWGSGKEFTLLFTIAVYIYKVFITFFYLPLSEITCHSDQHYRLGEGKHILSAAVATLCAAVNTTIQVNICCVLILLQSFIFSVFTECLTNYFAACGVNIQSLQILSLLVIIIILRSTVCDWHDGKPCPICQAGVMIHTRKWKETHYGCPFSLVGQNFTTNSPRQLVSWYLYSCKQRLQFPFLFIVCILSA